MPTVYSGEVEISNHNWFVMGENIGGPMETEPTGHVTAEEDHLWLNTSTSLGEVPVVINLFDGPPDPEAGWDEVHDTEFHVTEPSLMICGGMLDVHGDFAITPGRYRVRYYAKGVAAAWDRTADDEEPALDSYQLDIWPV